MNKKILIITCLVLGCLFIVGCGKEKSSEEKSLKEIIKENNYIIIDVRTKEEYDEEHIIGAINIPYDEINKDTKLDKKKTILVYCKSGVRSRKAYQTLKKLKYDVVDLGAYNTIDLEKGKETIIENDKDNK